MSGPGESRRRAGTAPVPVGPSLTVRLVMRPLTKMLNPLVDKLAGRRHVAMVAQIHHAGRRSGKRYVTPAGFRINGSVAIIPLTFGNQSDWARNISTAGECWVRWKGAAYHAVRPRFLDAADAAPLVRQTFGPVERLVFRLIGIRQFMQLQVEAGTGAMR